MKAINALRCMFNNLGTNAWAFGAGMWQLAMFVEATDSIRPLLNEGYEYVCTCLIDANGIKNMLGTSDQSN